MTIEEDLEKKLSKYAAKKNTQSANDTKEICYATIGISAALGLIWVSPIIAFPVAAASILYTVYLCKKNDYT